MGLREFNITNLIKDIVENNRTYHGILLRQPGSTDATYKFFYSHEGSTAPQLIVDYVSGLNAKVSGTWQDTDAYAKVSGVWQPVNVYGKVSGTWQDSK